VQLAGLCDIAELRHVRQSLERAGVVIGAGTGDHGFHACDADLEDELIRALGTARVEEIVEAEGDLRPWQTFLSQPAQHGRPRDQQLRRFLGTKKGRKIRYGHLLVESLEADRVPGPLEELFGALGDG